MKTGKTVVASVFIVVLLLSLVSGVYAITGSIGNARMILRPDLGDTIDRTILVKNVNDVALNIELSAVGDLADEFNIIDSEFQLAAGTEKNARFTVKITRSGTTETKINVKFSPLEKGNGVGLSSTIIIIPQGEEESSGGFFGGLFGGGSGSEEEVVEGNQENGEVSVGQNKNEGVTEEVGGVAESEEKGGIGMMVLGGTFTIILFVALLILLVVASKHIKKKKTDKKEKKKAADKKDKEETGDSDKKGESDKSKKEKSEE